MSVRPIRSSLSRSQHGMSSPNATGGGGKDDSRSSVDDASEIDSVHRAAQKSQVGLQQSQVPLLTKRKVRSACAHFVATGRPAVAAACAAGATAATRRPPATLQTNVTSCAATTTFLNGTTRARDSQRATGSKTGVGTQSGDEEPAYIRHIGDNAERDAVAAPAKFAAAHWGSCTGPGFPKGRPDASCALRAASGARRAACGWRADSAAAYNNVGKPRPVCPV